MKSSRNNKLCNSIAERVTVLIGEKHQNTEYLETGSTSTAFVVTTDTSRYVLRVAVPHAGKSASYESDYALRKRLWDTDLQVAKPIATNQSFDTGFSEKWALDEFREGSHPGRGRIAADVSKQLGTLLKTLHSIPVTGYGRFQDRRKLLRGNSHDPTQGLLSRFQSPWPFTSVSIEKHPAVCTNMWLANKLRALKDELFSFVLKSPATVVHSDLHEGQLLVSDGRLMALIDFNDAISGNKAWDFGSYLYFHGDSCLSDLLDGYTNDPHEKGTCTYNAFLASIMIALHHGNRGIVLDRPHRIDAAVRFLESRLS